jgi:hypothetical protein
MSAPQDIWAIPLAKELVDRFRSDNLTYVRITAGVYNETTGVAAATEVKITAAGAVSQSMKGERDGVEQGSELEVWIDHATVSWPLSTKDRLEYMGRRWKIVSIDPTYSSSDVKVYASRIKARAE